MKKWIFATALICSTIFGASPVNLALPSAKIVDKTPEKSETFSYFRTGSKFRAKEISEIDKNAIHFGVGVRTKGTHIVDLCSHVGINPSWVSNGFDVSYLYSPECLKGAYVGIGIHAGIVLSKNTYVIDSYNSPIPSMWYEPKGMSYKKYEAIPNKNFTMIEEWFLKLDADIPVILGYSYPVKDKLHFIQASVNENLVIMVTSGVGF